MKTKIAPFNRALLLLTTILFTPSIAAAQEPSPTPDAESAMPAEQSAPAEAEAQPPEDDGVVVDDAGEVTVLGRFIPEPMRQTSEVATFLSAEDLGRQGDDNAALALTRLTGLSVVSGRFVYVRGLGDRYSSALLNGSPLPSPEPLRRQVPLDLFPSNILDGATVQKTFSPNYPGEFGGGIIDLRTLRIPNESFLTLKAGTGGNTESTDKDGFTYYGEDSDWSTYADAARDIPGPLAEAMARGVRINDANFSDAELEAIGESLTNSPLTVVQRESLDPDFEGEITGGTSIDFGGMNLGLLGVFGYDSEMRTQSAVRDTVVSNALTTEIDSVSTNWDIVMNAFGSASLGWNDNQITLTGLFVRTSTKKAQVQDIADTNNLGGDTLARKESTAWYERQLTSLQLAGEHEFGALELDWRGAYAQSKRDAPYERDFTTFSVGGGPFQYSRPNNNNYFFSYLTDEVLSGGVDATYTIALSEQRDAVFTAGYAYSNTIRSYDLFKFQFEEPAGNPLPTDVQEARVDYLFSPDNIAPGRFVFTEATGLDDAYKGRLTVDAAYAAADVEILPLIRAAVGVRYEDATQTVRTGNRFGLPPNAPPVALSNAYWLPAATFTWNFAEDLQLRLGYSQTIARPQFRELAVTAYIDPETDRVYQGNPFLVDSELKNYDARIEYYFGRGQFVTGAAFYKTVENPIEEVIILNPNGAATLTRFINAPEATLWGFEGEYRTTFDAPFEVPFLSDPSLFFAVNYTYTKSEVSADGTVVNPITFAPSPAIQLLGEDKSPLQGTPENIANLQFGYETDSSELTLLVGWVDQRVARRGLSGLPSVIEDPGVNVDLVFRKTFTVGGSDLTLGLSGRNLLDEQHEEFQINPASDAPNAFVGRSEVNTYDRGRSFSASLTAKF